jgi:hypothetical protein
MAEKMSIDKKDPVKDDSEESVGTSPEADAPATTAPQENQAPKRKGGRKPVRDGFLFPSPGICLKNLLRLVGSHIAYRSMLRRKRESSVTGKPRQLSGNVGQSTSSS